MVQHLKLLILYDKVLQFEFGGMFFILELYVFAEHFILFLSQQFVFSKDLLQDVIFDVNNSI
jgi:hypothetical protein